MRRWSRRVLALGLVVLLFLPARHFEASPAKTAAPRADNLAVVQQLEQLVAHEMADKALPALAIALVEGDEVLWMKGFGWEDPEARRPASENSVFRIASLSKLFTDIAIMQLVERGELDLDAPVERYLPSFRVQNPFGKPVTLRHLMSHRAGLVREPPLGSYFDPEAPSLAETVASLNATALVHEPGQRTKYSNAAIAVAGYVLEQLKGKPFAAYLEEAVLAPMGMARSSFTPRADLLGALARGSMWTYDRRVFAAPVFEFGMVPAAGMYATLADLAQFLRVLLSGGRGAGGQVVKAETLELMWTPQFVETGTKTGYGLGFFISESEGWRRVSHSGIVYGHATELLVLPEAGLGVVAVTTMDCANAVVRRIAEHALRLMLAQRAGLPLPAIIRPEEIPAERARRLAGRYTNGEESITLRVYDGRLYISRRELKLRLKALHDTLIVDDRLAFGSRLQVVGETLVLGKKVYARQPESCPAAAPSQWSEWLGEYGWDHNTLYILEQEGRLHVLIEWFYKYPLTELGGDRFLFPDYGLYAGEALRFVRSAGGQVSAIEAAGILFQRRRIGGSEGAAFRITPRLPVAELRRLAQAAQPPHESGNFLPADMVELQALDATIRYDVRYATANNFMNAAFYEGARAFLQRPAATALVRVHRALQRQGYGLLIHDAYRPWHVTKMFWEATPPDYRHFVADPERGSRHNRGAAVDLTLYELATGAAVEMPSGYDEFSPRAHPEYPGGTSRQRWHRDLLRSAMEAEGFQVNEFEWWHFDFPDWQRYPILNLTFEEIHVHNKNGSNRSAR